MICPEYADPKYLFFADGVSPLVYYSHFSSIIVSAFVGFFVYFKNRNELVNKLLFLISITFIVWTVMSLVTWTSNRSDIIMFDWALDGFVYILLCCLALYFFYVFVDKRDIKFKNKLIFVLFLFPVVVFTPTKYNLPNFLLDDCASGENQYFTNYYYGIGLLIFMWVLFVAINRYKKSDPLFKKQVLLMALGVEFFLITFFINGFLASYLFDKGLVDDYSIDQYGLFGMTFFMGMLAYMIVRFNAFNIKLIGAQALVVTLFILIAAQFAFIRNPTNMILNGVALFLITIFGYILIRNVKREIAQKEALAVANAEISERKNQLQKISDHLAVANDKLKELDTAKNEFVSIVAHQLQGPPTTVKGYSMLLVDGTYGEMTPDQKDVLNKIFNANEQQIDFVRDLLNVSRLESGRINFVFETCSVVDICQDVIDNLFVKARDKGLYLEYNKTTNDIPAVNVDKAKIREAVTNLMDNAIKYTKKGGVTVSIKVCSGTEKCLIGSHVRITVSDTGIGIPQSEIPHLFSKFSRGKDVKRLNASGTGLGLYVVKMVVEGNHGQVWIESDGDGMGSRFIIELPIA